MRLAWTGIVPAWAVVALLLALAVLAVAGYRRSRLASPWALILPALRLAALALLALTLLQPVLRRTFTLREPAVIPVIVDDSGSMSVADRRSPVERLRLAWQLGLFPRQLRQAGGEELAGRWPALSAGWQALSGNAVALAAELPASGACPAPAAERLAALAGRLEVTAGELEAAAAGLPAAQQLQAAGNVRKDLAASAAGARALAGRLKPAAVRDAAAALRETATWSLRAASCGNALAPLQDAEDTALLAAREPAVDQAVARLDGITRLDLARLLLSPAGCDLAGRLGRKGTVALYGLAEPVAALGGEQLAGLAAARPHTRLGTAVRGVLKHLEDRPLAAVVLLSDGAWNSGVSVPEARRLLDEARVPLLAVGIGSPRPPPDIAVERVLAPTSAFVEDEVRLQVELVRRGFADRPLRLVARGAQGVLAEQTVPPGPAERLTVELAFREEQPGLRDYTVAAEALEGEILRENNGGQATVCVLKDRIRVLLVDGFPRWETRYAAMMLTRDRRVALDALFPGSMPGGRLKKGPGGFPLERRELFAYHVLVLGDVDPRQFTMSQLEDIRAFVLERGGVLLVMAGPSHMPADWAGTPVGAVLPFTLGGVSATGTGVAPPEGLRLELARTGAYDDLARVAADPLENGRMWRELPGMNWVRDGVKPSPSAELLAFTEGERRPVLLWGNAGLGRVLYLGTDSFWRWRYRARWTYHHRLWGQVLLWATLGRTTGDDPLVKVMTDRPCYAPEEPVQVRARILDRAGNPVEHAAATVEVLDETGTAVKTVSLVGLEDSGGEYRAELHGLPCGRYGLRPRVMELGDRQVEGKAGFEVKDLPTSEFVALSLDEARLQALAAEYRPCGRAGEIPDLVQAREREERKVVDWEAWDSAWLLLAVALLLSGEWMLRKRLNLA